MNKAKFLASIVELSPNTVRVWFGRQNKSLNDPAAVREYLIHKLVKRSKRSDKGNSRPTPWLDGYKFSAEGIRKSKCVICGKITAKTRKLWDMEKGEEKTIFICCDFFNL